jgi:hypothetical protein
LPDRGIPEDFPQATPGGAVPGVQPKLGVAKVGMSYVATENPAQTREVRFALCVDLVQQLFAYWQRKRTERPDEAADELLEKVLASAEKKRFAWGLSPAEADWVAYSLRAAARNRAGDGE